MDLLKKIIQKEKDRVLFFNYPGLIFYLSGSFRWTGDDCVKKYGLSQPYVLVYFKDKKMLFDSPFEVGLGDWVFKELAKKKIAFIDGHKIETIKQINKVERWLKNHKVKENNNLASYCANLRKSSNLLVEATLVFQIAGGTTDNHFEEKINQLISEYEIRFLEQDLIKLATANSKKSSALATHERDISLFAKWLKEKKLINRPYEKIIQNQQAKKYLKRCYQDGYFLYSGYGGVKFWTHRDEYNLILEYINKKKERELENKSAELFNIKKLPRELIFWLGAADYFSHLRDLRKTLQQKIFYWQASAIEKIAQRVKIRREDLEFLIADEFRPDLFKNDQAKKIIAERKRGFVWLWTENHGSVSYQGKEALVFFKKYTLRNNKSSYKIRTLRGQTAFPGKIKGKVAVILNPHKADNFKRGNILVAGTTTPDFVPLLKKSKAIVTDTGGVTCHAAIIAREVRKPCIIGTKIATQVLKDGDLVEVDADKGVVRKIK
ncbi:hypothetical protein GYA13_01725 [Candidatus Kuenenbacteria bacterium]|nr:hypothetical protein [Candidatus Kuenenbacteria bacterium]